MYGRRIWWNDQHNPFDDFFYSETEDRLKWRKERKTDPISRILGAEITSKIVTINVYS
jgi:hypothetical protein